MAQFIKNNIKTISHTDEDYPKEFLAIGKEKPLSVYCLGNMDLLHQEHKVAIIGARKADRKGDETAYKLGAQYAKKGYVIVSGLALGCDAAAHRGCLDADGKTIAIVGTGLDLVFPKENEALQNEILRKGGLVISEQPFGVKASGQTLVARNRLQAALSELVIVAQCPLKSGTIHTVHFAQRYGKSVQAVAFNYWNDFNAGNRYLIEEENVTALKL